MLELHLKLYIKAVESTDSRHREPGILSWLYHFLTSRSTSRGAGGRAREEER